MKEEKQITEVKQDDLQKFAEELPDISYTSIKPFSEKISKILRAPIDPKDIEIRPDGIIFLPEIKYRKILLDAFGAGGWAIKIHRIYVQNQTICTHCFLFAQGRYVSEAIGSADYFENNKSMDYATCIESARSNTLMRCCKDLGIASELWNPTFIKEFKKEYCKHIFYTNIDNKSKDFGVKKKLWFKKNDEPQWPWSNSDENIKGNDSKKMDKKEFTDKELYDSARRRINRAITENDYEALSILAGKWNSKECIDRFSLYDRNLILNEIERAQNKISEQLDEENDERSGLPPDYSILKD